MVLKKVCAVGIVFGFLLTSVSLDLNTSLVFASHDKDEMKGLTNIKTKSNDEDNVLTSIPKGHILSPEEFEKALNTIEEERKNKHGKDDSTSWCFILTA
jgi:hypothetical protein